jgi:hypothetical protein
MTWKSRSCRFTSDVLYSFPSLTYSMKTQGLLVVSSWRLSSSECLDRTLISIQSCLRYWRQPRVPAFSVKHIRIQTTKFLYPIHKSLTGRLNSGRTSQGAILQRQERICSLYLRFCHTPYICSRMDRLFLLLASLETTRSSVLLALI